ncbi:MAG: DivIVA domain-containing protein [Clostridia bacterium]
MLTPAQVKNHRFEVSGRGHYRADAVDAFLDEVYESYSQMFKENGDLVRKIGLLADKVEEYRNDEDNIRAALLTAQRMADKIVKEAKESVEGKISDAQQTAQNLVDEARQKANAIMEEARASAKEMGDQAEAQARQVLLQAKQQASDEAGRITSDAKKQLDEMNREIALRAVEFQDLSREVSVLKTDVAAACTGLEEILERLTVRAAAELDQKIASYIQTQAQVVPEDIPVTQSPTESLPADASVKETPTPSAEPVAAEPVPSAEKKEAVEVEIDPTVVDDDFSISHQPSSRGGGSGSMPNPEKGFNLNLDNLDKTADYQNLFSGSTEDPGKQLKFGEGYDVFEDEDEDEGEERPSRSFLNLFKK